MQFGQALQTETSVFLKLVMSLILVLTRDCDMPCPNFVSRREAVGVPNWD